MAPVSIRFGDDARAAMMRGVERLANSVAVTLGPAGRTVLIERAAGGAPRVTKDGVTVADALEEAGRWEQMGLRLVRRAAQRVGEEFGDGTTTTVVLARARLAEGMKVVAAGVDPMALRRGLEAGAAAVTADLRARAVPVGGRGDIARIATIAANGDRALGEVIADAFVAGGADGVVTIEAGETFETAWERLPGLQWEGGYVSPYFMTDAATTACVYEKPLILLTDRRLETHEALLRPLEAAVTARRPLLIVAEAVTGEALQTLVTNKVRNNLRVVAGKAPLFGDRRQALLEDIAAVTGATVVSADCGGAGDRIDPAVLGNAERIELTKDRTTVIGGAGRAEDIARRADGIRAEQGLKGNTPYQETFLGERLARLAGGVAVVRIGGASEAEIGERRDRALDAAGAVRAAVRDGVLPGGGAAYLHAITALGRGRAVADRAAHRILSAALQAPAARIATNAGHDGRNVVARILDDGRVNLGFDAAAGKYVDLVRAGVIDPAAVSIAAFETAVSVAALLLTVEVAVAKPPPPPRAARADDIPFGPEAKDMTAEEAGDFGLV